MLLLDQVTQQRRSSLLILFLLGVDLALIGLHLVHGLTTWITDLKFSIQQDQGYAEIFQYIQTCGIAFCLGWLAWIRKSPLLGCWAFIFLALLFDDVLMLHESSSAALADGFNLPEFLGLQPADYSKVFIYAGVGLLALTLALVGHILDPDATAREASMFLILSVMGLVCFGCVVDMIHIALEEMYGLNPMGSLSLSLTILEEGGELVVISRTFWFVWNLFKLFRSSPV